MLKHVVTGFCLVNLWSVAEVRAGPPQGEEADPRAMLSQPTPTASSSTEDAAAALSTLALDAEPAAPAGAAAATVAPPANRASKAPTMPAGLSEEWQPADPAMVRQAIPKVLQETWVPRATWIPQATWIPRTPILLLSPEANSRPRSDTDTYVQRTRPDGQIEIRLASDLPEEAA